MGATVQLVTEDSVIRQRGCREVGDRRPVIAELRPSTQSPHSFKARVIFKLGLVNEPSE